ncbi:MAG: tRNA preQ1(34) S-adenosylmethionine ribosyltransferase-isomerase QueA [Bacillota bacterium]|nr:tRNA preQ1(34) S-adenosylmethionine ribosyltransferase-isomerase QueA [Bacillota bacterium]
MKVKDFFYDLPEELIAQEPIKDRDSSRLMVLHKNSGEIDHKTFKNIKDYLKVGDCLVLNDTRVLPARLYGYKEGTGAQIEFVLIKRMNGDIWEVILKPGRKAKVGSRFIFGDGLLKAEVIEIVEEGNRLVRFEYDGIFEHILDKVGLMPLPPYITKRLEDSERYQTVYSKNKGSAAAPTAGLHFTQNLLDELRGMGVNIVYITLHVGLGTFRPVKVENILEHKMHSEFYSINEDACSIINEAKNNGKKIVAVGTTSCRVLETVGNADGRVLPGSGNTDIFIYPGYKFKVVDMLITNFHLPESTLIMLVSALVGRENTLNAYKTAVEERYRFFSFGDAMMIIDS